MLFDWVFIILGALALAEGWGGAREPVGRGPYWRALIGAAVALAAATFAQLSIDQRPTAPEDPGAAVETLWTALVDGGSSATSESVELAAAQLALALFGLWVLRVTIRAIARRRMAVDVSWSTHILLAVSGFALYPLVIGLLPDKRGLATRAAASMPLAVSEPTTSSGRAVARRRNAPDGPAVRR